MLFATLFRANFFTLIRELIEVDQLEVTTDSDRATVLKLTAWKRTFDWDSRNGYLASQQVVPAFSSRRPQS